MTQIKTIDKAALLALRPEIDAALAALGEKFGLTLRTGNGSFGGDAGRFTLEIKTNDPAVKAEAGRKSWNANCTYIGLDFNRQDETGLRPEDFGTEFTYGSGARAVRYRTTGIALRGKGSQKFPILVETLDGPNAGKTMMLPETAVPTIRSATDAAKAGLPGFAEFADKKRREATA